MSQTQTTISVILKDGTKKEIPTGSTGLDLAKSISNSLAKKSVGLSVNGELQDLVTVLKDGDRVEIITQDDERSYEFLRHSSAHVLAAAVQNLFKSAKIANGPAIEDGFYYDFEIRDHQLTPEDLLKIEKEMQRIVDEEQKFLQVKVENPDKQIEEFKKIGEKFKAENLNEHKDHNPTLYLLQKDGKTTWNDFCKGPHITTSKQIKAFKLLSISGAYWHGDETREKLQRIYGTSWWSKEDLDAYINRLEEAEKRDHRKLGRQLDLFSIQDETGPGLILWHPKLAFVRTQIENFWRELHSKNGYELVYTPHIARNELWNISGHNEFYKENMFYMNIDDQEYVLKPMNCPFHVKIFDSTRHSYRDLPIRLAELGTVYRYERSGVMHGLARVRGFTQDDAHIFCRKDQFVDEIKGVIKLVDEIYSKFGLEYSAELSTKPKDAIGSNENWEFAEAGLMEALKGYGLNYQLNPGDGAFYGPKIDFKLKDAIGRVWQGATIQLDFNLPQRFDIKYTDKDGSQQQPVMVHRAIFGSLERIAAVLIEHFAGAFPLWLSHKQVIVLPITDRHLDYANKIATALKEKNVRIEIDTRAESVNSKIRDAELEKIPYMIIIGDNEARENNISVRARKKGDLGKFNLEDFIVKIEKEISEKSI
ncbi:MAG: threonine--tRNA ligase [Candidatus Melainabacteria bacterium RIFCSPHIGHO2_02_FULL_34_12]|nr:MAG: threonine--tRNA ligase [Candidatus Melainabacteria bacterium RIFCSPHIGHO2_02_FULL_34_12]